MFEKNLLEEIQEAKIANEIGHVCFFNTGEVQKETRDYASHAKDEWRLDDSLRNVGHTLTDATKSYATRFSFDTIQMDLKMGLVYNAKDVDEQNNIKEGAQPLDGIVRYYTGSVRSYLDGEQTNDRDYAEYGVFNYQGYVNYNKLVARLKKGGVEFNGPKSFNEFKEALAAGEPFRMLVTASLTKTLKKEPEEPIKEEQQVVKAKRFGIFRKTR